MPTKLTRRAIASRANGRLSRGPVTEAGKKRSSFNAFRHGLLSRNILLDGESADGFQLLHNHFIDELHPDGDAQHNYVEEIAAAVWKTRRLWQIETCLFEEAMQQCESMQTRRPD